MRTLRNGCFDTTVAAKSCTATDAEIRFTSAARMPMNSSSDPRASSLVSTVLDIPKGKDTVITGHSSFQSTPSVLGNAVNTTPTPSTMATSSSCEMPASRAASKSSLLMEKEIVKLRSEPRLDSDSDISAYLSGMTERKMDKRTVLDACRESVGLQIDARRQNFVLRRLLVGPRSSAQPRGARTGRGRRRVTSYTCEAGIFGTTFANLSHICRDDLRVRPEVLRAAMYDVLMPAAKNFAKMTGPDVKHLARGLGSYRVLRPQFPRLIEGKVAPRIQSSDGHPACAFGATAAILVLFKVLAGEPSALELGGPLDAGGLGTQLEKVIQATFGIFADWPLQEPLDAAALCAEQRALQRAYVGIRLARMCDVPHESVQEAFLRRLDFYWQCAWPACGFALGREKHHQMLDAIASGSIVSDEWVREDNCFLAPMVDDGSVIALSALAADDFRHTANVDPDAYRDNDDDNDNSSMTATTSPSTLVSASSCGDDDSTADPDESMQDAVGEALRVAQLAIAAATAATGLPSNLAIPSIPEKK